MTAVDTLEWGEDVGCFVYSFEREIPLRGGNILKNHTFHNKNLFRREELGFLGVGFGLVLFSGVVLVYVLNTCPKQFQDRILLD